MQRLLLGCQGLACVRASHRCCRRCWLGCACRTSLVKAVLEARPDLQHVEVRLRAGILSLLPCEAMLPLNLHCEAL